MFKRPTFLVVFTSIIIFTAGTSASAAENNLPSAPALSPHQLYELALIKYKIELSIYQDAREVREQQLRAIANTFNQALKQAHEEARSAGKNASSKATFAAARAIAAANRDRAVADLEPLMSAPLPPEKPIGYSAKTNKSKASSPKAEKKN
jgi:flagellar biosynthesis/type III secretory pathway protein FliH